MDLNLKMTAQEVEDLNQTGSSGFISVGGDEWRNGTRDDVGLLPAIRAHEKAAEKKTRTTQKTWYC